MFLFYWSTFLIPSPGSDTINLDSTSWPEYWNNAPNTESTNEPSQPENNDK